MKASRACPYPGPRSFDPGESLYGRDRETLEILDLLVAERIALLHAPSGAGKTSLIQAALRPALEQEEFRVLPIIRVGLESTDLSAPSENRYVASAIASLERRAPDNDRVSESELSRTDLTTYLDQRTGGTDEQHVLIFDQFEEVLTFGPNAIEEKRAFFEDLGRALRPRTRWALFAMREDFLAALDPYRRAVPTRLRNTYRLDLLSVEGAMSAVREPAENVGVSFDADAAKLLVDDLRRINVQTGDGETRAELGPYVEPVQLQVACTRLWARLAESSDHITESDVRGLGDVSNALAEYYAGCVHRIAESTGVGESLIRTWMGSRLITPQGIRGQVLLGSEQSDGLSNKAVRALVSDHLVRAEPRLGATWFELAHDRLIEPVREDNARWQQAHLSPLQRQADVWAKEDRLTRLLLQDDALEQAESWARDHANEVGDVEQAFLDESRIHQSAVDRQRQQTKRIRRLEVSTIFAIVVGAALAVFELVQVREENFNNKVQLRRALSESAVDHLTGRPQQSLLLAIEALKLGVSLDAENEAIPAIQTLRYVTNFVEGEPLQGAPAQIIDGARSADGSVLVLSGAGGKLMLYEAGGLEPTSSLDVREEPTALALSPRGELLAVGDARRRVQLFARGEAKALSAGNHDSAVSTLAFDPDHRFLAAGLHDGVVLVWKLASLEEPPIALEDAGVRHIHALAFRPGVAVLAAAGDSNVVNLWNLDDSPSPTKTELCCHDSTIGVVVFSSTGRILATGSEDNSAILWDTESRRELHRLEGHRDDVVAVAFSPDEARLATGSLDYTARLWDVGTGAALPAMMAHRDELTSVSFMPDGRWLATGAEDNVVKLWQLDAAGDEERGITLRGHEHGIMALSLSAGTPLRLISVTDRDARQWNIDKAIDDRGLFLVSDAQLLDVSFSVDAAGNEILASGGTDRLTRIWRVGAPTSPPVELSGHTNNVTAVEFSPDQKHLVTGSRDKTVRFWDLGSDPPTLAHMRTLEDEIYALDFHPAGDRLAAGSLGVGLSFVPVDPDSPIEKNPIDDAVAAVAYSPDARLLATGSPEGRLLLWNLESKETPPRLLRGHDNDVTAVAFSPSVGTDRKLVLASGDQNGRLLLWPDPENVDEPQPLSGHPGAITDLAFDASGRWLASSGLDATLRLWQVDFPSAAPLILGGRSGYEAVTFGPEGTWIAGADNDRISLTRSWMLSSEQSQDPSARRELIARACRLADRNLRRDEWQHFLGAEPYRQTCPELDTPEPEEMETRE